MMKRWGRLCAVMTAMAMFLAGCGSGSAGIGGSAAAGAGTETKEMETAVTGTETEGMETAVTGTEEEGMETVGMDTEPAGTGADAQEDTTGDDGRFAVTVEDYISEEGSYQDGVGNTAEYSFHIPRIASDLEGAKKVNAEIAEFFEPFYQESKKGMKDGVSLLIYGIHYQSYQYGSLLCLLVEAETDWENNIYATYAYDARTDEPVDKAGLLERAGLTSEEFAKKARQAMAAAVDRSYWTWDMDDDQTAKMYYGEILPCRTLTLSDANIEATDKLYLDDEGRLGMIATLYTPAGSGRSYERLALDDPGRTQVPDARKVVYESITAELEQGKVYVTIGEPTEKYPYHTEGIRIGQRQLVQGLSGKYADLFIGNIGQSVSPYLVLTSAAGTYECIDLLSAATTDFTCGSLPLPGLSEIDRFSEEDGGRARTIFARTSDGKSYDLTFWLYRASLSLPGRFVGSVWGPEPDAASGKGTFRLQFGDGGEFVFSESVSDGVSAVNAQGTLSLISASPQGMVYKCRLAWEKDGSLLTGLLSLCEDPIDYDVMTVRILAGDDLFGQGIGQEIRLIGVRAYGRNR